jgi:uncharacterized protein (DUF849 family)
MENPSPIMIMTAPNGARRSKADHPEIPLTPGEIARTASSCLEAGASILHLHVRDALGAHTLDAGIYSRAMEEIHRLIGEKMVIQVTTEAVGRYRASEQMQIVDILHPEAVSLALREIIPDESTEHEATVFLSKLAQRRIWPQFILYAPGELYRFIRLYKRGLIPFHKPFLLFVLGQYGCCEARPADLDPFLEILGEYKWPWMVCAFGRHEAACMDKAARLGGHLRVGFENNLVDANGKLVGANEDLVKQATLIARKSRRSLLSAVEIRDLIPKWAGE